MCVYIYVGVCLCVHACLYITYDIYEHIYHYDMHICVYIIYIIYDNIFCWILGVVFITFKTHFT